MKKVVLLAILCIFISGCSSKTSEEANVLKENGITSIKECKNTKAIAASSGDAFIKEKAEVYCAIDANAKHLNQANAFVKKGYDSKRISEFLSVDYYDASKTDRYLAFDDKKQSPSDVVTRVNIGLDKPYYTDADIIETMDSNLLLVNKYHKLPEGYVPKDLVETPYACTIGKEFSCQSEKQFVVKEVAEQFKQMVEAAKMEQIDILSIASYRSYAYQKSLYDYNANTNGVSYADQYYARPGQSEHNSGLAIDVTINDSNYNEIENNPNYAWLLAHMADYGFILRYPSDKVDITGYGYESWHLRYVGERSATEIMRNHSTLDEYIAQGGNS